MTSQWLLYRSNKGLRNILYAQGISVLGDWFNTVALMGLVYGKTKSGLYVSLLLISEALPGLLISPFAGHLVDRMDKRTVMIVSDVLRGLLVPLFLFVDSFFWLIFPVKALLSIASTFFSPARQSMIPQLVKPDELIAANTFFSMIWGLMGVLGASIGGFLSAGLGYSWAFVINAVSFFISALFVARLRSGPSKGTPSNGLQKESLLSGLNYILKFPVVLTLILVGISWGVVGGAYHVLLPVFGAGVFDAGDQGIGLLYGTQGLAIFLGGILVPYLTGNRIEKMKHVFGWSYLLQGLFFIVFCLSNQLWIGVAALFAMRLMGGFIIPIDTTLLHTYTPTHMHGRVFAIHHATYGSVMQVSMFTTGLLVRSFSPQIVGSVFGMICFAVSLVWLGMLYTGKLKAVSNH